MQTQLHSNEIVLAIENQKWQQGVGKKKILSMHGPNILVMVDQEWGLARFKVYHH